MAISIKAKLIGLSGSLLMTLMCVAGVEYRGQTLIRAKLFEVSNIHLPAIRNMSLVDMMHDGLRAVVLTSLRAAESASTEDDAEVKVEIKEFSENFEKYLGAIDKLDVPETTKKAISEARPAMDRYLAKSNEIVALALSGKRSAAEASMPAFETAFKDLEGKLEILGEMIEKDAQISRDEGKATGDFFARLGLILVFLGLFMGFAISFYIVRDLTQTSSRVIEQLTSSSQEVSKAAALGASAATQFSAATSQQTTSLQATVSAVHEISAMVKQTADSATMVQEAVDGNREASQAGIANVSEMVSVIQEVREINERILGQMSNSIQELQEIVSIISGIGSKTEVINDIVFQTKLLSFNASVEAARAGEQGKGFAVVAQEVGNLAQMSGAAAKEITAMLTDSIRRVKEIAEVNGQRMNELSRAGTEKVNRGQATAQKCGEALTRIGESAENIARMVTEITIASKEQAEGVNQINQSIEQLNKMTVQNQAAAESSAEQAGELHDESQKLDRSVTELEVFVRGSAGVVKKAA